MPQVKLSIDGIPQQKNPPPQLGGPLPMMGLMGALGGRPLMGGPSLLPSAPQQPNMNLPPPGMGRALPVCILSLFLSFVQL